MSSHKINTRTRILETTRQLMEQNFGLGVRMSDIAKAASVSRQALYWHFASRTELIVATVQYVDEMHGLDQQLAHAGTIINGIALLERYVEIWGKHVPEIYGLGKALLATRDTDEAAAAAWDDRMGLLQVGCQAIVAALAHDGVLTNQWPQSVATELCYTLLSLRNWEQLTIAYGWTTTQYIDRMQTLLKRVLITQTEAENDP